MNKGIISNFAQKLDEYETRVLKDLLVGHNIPSGTFKQILKTEFNKNLKLAQSYLDSPMSVFASIVFCAQLGLIPTRELGQFFFKINQTSTGTLWVSPMIGYLGLVEIIYRNPKIKSISSESVHEGDIFEYELGLNPILKHQPLDPIRNADTLTHVYVVVELSNGLKQFKVISKYELLQNIATMKGKSDLYFSKHDPNFWMLKKIALKQISKTLPKDYLSAMAMKFDDNSEAGKVITLDEDNQVIFQEDEPKIKESSLLFDIDEDNP